VTGWPTQSDPHAGVDRPFGPVILVEHADQMDFRCQDTSARVEATVLDPRPNDSFIDPTFARAEVSSAQPLGDIQNLHDAVSNTIRIELFVVKRSFACCCLRLMRTARKGGVTCTPANAVAGTAQDTPARDGRERAQLDDPADIHRRIVAPRSRPGICRRRSERRRAF
jgi:hypothetical protein